LPTYTTTEQAWLDRYGDWYSTDEDRRAAYRDYRANLAELTAIFNMDGDAAQAGRRGSARAVSISTAKPPCASPDAAPTRSACE
jgi:hypothetical protein